MGGASSFGTVFRRRLHPRLMMGAYNERELKKMSLVELKEAAGTLGITNPEGHKGRKSTWSSAIEAASSSAPVEAASAATVEMAAASTTEGAAKGMSKAEVDAYIASVKADVDKIAQARSSESEGAAKPAAATAAATTLDDAVLEVFKPDAAVAPTMGDSMDDFFAALLPSYLPALTALCQPGAPAEPLIQAAAAASEAASRAALADPEYSEADLKLLAETMDFLQGQLLTFGDEDADPEEDPDFIAEGRKILALDRFVVSTDLPDEEALLGVVLTELAALVRPVAPAGLDPSEALGGEPAGTLLLTPGFSGGDVKAVLAGRVAPALGWLGLAVGEGAASVDLKGYRFSEGAPCPLLRLLYQVETAAVAYAPGEGPSEAAFGDSQGGMVDGNALVRELAEALKAEDEEKMTAAAVDGATAELKESAAARAKEDGKAKKAAAKEAAAKEEAAASVASVAEAEVLVPKKPTGLLGILMGDVSDNTLGRLVK